MPFDYICSPPPTPSRSSPPPYTIAFMFILSLGKNPKNLRIKTNSEKKDLFIC